MQTTKLFSALVALFMVLSGCENQAIEFSPMGPLSTEGGRGSFRFGTATAAVQIEEGLTQSDWHHWTLPEDEGGRGNGLDFVGNAVFGKQKASEDIDLIANTNLEAYRFNIDWSRVEPKRNEISQEALNHYDLVLNKLATSNIQPMVTIHHFSSPLWVENFIASSCSDSVTPTDENLCGWGHKDGAEQVIQELADHAALLAKRYGDRVDEWCTLNEPINYLTASYGIGVFPPGHNYILTDFPRLVAVYRNYLRAHVAIYDAIRANDTIDADGDGVAASIGLSLNTAYWEASRDNSVSTASVDQEARDRMKYFYHYFYPDALVSGSIDNDLNGTADESYPAWQGKLDWLGIQYYFRAGVTASPALLPGIDASVCVNGLDFGSCLPPQDPSHWVSSLNYEYNEAGLLHVLDEISTRYPTLPLILTESGIAAENAVRRTEHIVRTLEQVSLAIDHGVDIRGYYHWSLVDNFEWMDGYRARFGLFKVDRDTYKRTPTHAAHTLRNIAGVHTLTKEQRVRYGGEGPMSAEFQ